MRPCRIVGVGLAATWNLTSPAPWPEAGLNPVIQLTSDAALQAHSACVATVTLADPPLASRAPCGAESETWHLAGVGAVETVADEPHAAAPTAADVRIISSVLNLPSGLSSTRNQQHRGQPGICRFRPVRRFSARGSRGRCVTSWDSPGRYVPAGRSSTPLPKLSSAAGDPCAASTQGHRRVTAPEPHRLGRPGVHIACEHEAPFRPVRAA
jgi:hypothetical protein